MPPARRDRAGPQRVVGGRHQDLVAVVDERLEHHRDQLGDAVADEDVLDADVAQAVRLVVVRHRGAGGVDALGVAVALRLGQVVDHVGEDRLGRLEAERRRVADVELEDPVPLGLEPLGLDQDRPADVVADVAAASGSGGSGARAHPLSRPQPAYDGVRRPRAAHRPGRRCHVAQGRPADAGPSRRARGALPHLPVLGARPGRRQRVDEPAAEKEAWISAVLRDWGSCGRVVLVDDRPVGLRALRAAGVPARAPARFPTAPVSPDAVLLSAVYVDPAARGGGLGRMLVQGMARDLIERGGIHAVEAFGDTRGPASVGARRCVTPVDFLTSVGLQDAARPRDHPADADGPAQRAVVARRGGGGAGAAARGGPAGAEGAGGPPAGDQPVGARPR